jgi:stage II sporulation protein D
MSHRVRVIFLTIILFLLCFSSFSINLKIRIYSQFKIDSISILPVSGQYSIINLKSKKAIEFNNLLPLKIYYNNNKVYVYNDGKNLGHFDSLKIKGSGIMYSFRIKLLNKKFPDRIYNDDVIIKPKNKSLLIINDVELDHYVAGVVEAESGNKISQPEFYKVQSIICRTYALKNYKKHLNEGYNLCDLEHCQMYKGRCSSTNIILSASQTNGDVIVDKDNNLINAAFHANCGGQTVNSEDVWSKPATYLVSRNDSFCLKMTKAAWEKTILKKDMLNFLAKNNVHDSTVIDSLMKFQQNKRKALFYDTIKLRQVRKYFDLKSTYFSITSKGDSLLLKGRGNGHGIGLCQEGAMNMTMHGYNFNDVIKYYYRDVQIVNFNKNISQFNKIVH